MAISFQRQTAPSLAFNLTPLIDVVFQLLVFFMLSSTFLQPSLNLTLPQAGSSKEINPDQKIILSLDEAGQLYLNQSPLAIESLGVALKNKFKALGDQEVYFRGDADIRYREFFKIMEIAMASGSREFHLIHEQE